MEKIVMPKNSALLNEIEAVLKIYYEADGWLPNEEYKIQLKELIGADQYSSSYTKKSQITSYFGFTEWQDINNAQSQRRITTAGKKMYEALMASDKSAMQEIIMDALENIKFGRDNFGVPSSNSDVEPPSLFIRGIIDLDYLSYKEFAYLLNSMVDHGKSYTESILEVRAARNKGGVVVPEEAQKYVDCKPIMMLERWGFLEISKNSEDKGIVINPSVFEKFSDRLKSLKIYNVDKFLEINQDVSKLSKENIIRGGENILLYGVPGSGKSYKIATEYCNDENRMERLVFHPDYMNTDFVGQIMPTVKDNGDITYLFSPGPFTRIVKKAIANPSEHYYLVIEELNRGNAPGIFGEIFQLLDRSVSGESVYGINNSILATEIYGDKSHQIKIPSNLSLLATMNTADQNVFTLDTAFQRRWTMEMIENDVDLSKYGNYFIADTQYSWKVFNKVINKKILETSSQTLTSEDKRMGAYFISGNVLNIERIRQVPAGDSGKDFNKKNKRFAEKVLKYLWDDAFKFNREDIFDVALYPSLEAIIKRFTDNDNPENGRFDVFAKDIKEELENLREATLIDNNIDTGEEDADSTE
ncbi:McrB family protein [Streptococcus orisratti]|uniref:McrB family protein n=1 Tax=Streptococcus TaxID=1301 RepID=UPI0004155069|nr:MULTISPECIES: AAA family ATPase [Streptococcus]MBO4125905.1 AAA family ATPase [Streptococcus suis]MBM6533055.1 AAA family ATPase [Streptococcus dysgalactiae subsp. equisimilis]MCK3917718.1 AAA domain-containing protein [Streptococcus suis]HEL1551222.1 AAA family ATPase [Streptococcus suis]HEM3163718.1 AAA family ATPase [Streptococcus suis 92-1191]